MHTLIVGGGPAGMMAAIAASACGDQITILDHQTVLGKKILSTGNGRCNLTNSLQKMEFYHSQTDSFFVKALEAFGYEDTLRFFEHLGILLVEKNGYYYPRSMQAAAIRNVLENEVVRRGADVRLEQHVTDIIPDFKGKGQFLVKTVETSFAADRVILACGGKAAAVLGSDGSGYELVKKLGHTIVAPVPALTGMKIKNCPLRKANGVRCSAKVSLCSNGKELIFDTGELQITDYGISGIPVFQICYMAGRLLLEKKQAVVKINFLPEFEKEELYGLMEQLMNSGEKDILAVMNGLFPEKLSICLLKAAGLPIHIPAGRVNDDKRALNKLITVITSLTMEIQEINDFSKAQVTAGGIDAKDVDPDTMESKLIPGLYFAGEILDVDGICGGYNLQWAWASGFAAGRNNRNLSL